MHNHLKYQTSPYLLQHAQNPVDWYPWCGEAFQRAKAEDKPVFLSIGYSTCHWCHVMAHESFEDQQIADLLNGHFISIKVDREERPDIDSVYMEVCQAFTGSGGWPTSIFMTADQKPFFAGTYFPKSGRGGMIGLRELLMLIAEQWNIDRAALLEQADEMVAQLGQKAEQKDAASPRMAHGAAAQYKQLYDARYGGFGGAPKFPTAHNLLFLLTYYERYGDDACLDMAENTLLHMYRGGLFDHIGYGFCRYSTDERFLVPHFEKMLYDNALLIMAYCKAYAITNKRLYLEIAQKTADYILREMTDLNGGFYCAQDADSDGEEGKYYLFTPDEIINLLGPHKGGAFNRYFGITPKGNFEGKSIPNLLGAPLQDAPDPSLLLRVWQYRKKRCFLHLDDKILTAWNGLMIAAMCQLYRVSGNVLYLNAAKKADGFLQQHLYHGGVLFASFRSGKCGAHGFLDDYAGYIFAKLALYAAVLDGEYLQQAQQLCQDALRIFQDPSGGFYLNGTHNEELILRPKPTYDGAIPSGNSMMAWNLARLALLTADESYQRQAAAQLDFLAADAARFPAGHAMFLLALLDYYNPPLKITAVLKNPADKEKWLLSVPLDAAVLLLQQPTREFPLKNDADTFYVCRNQSCLPPVNDLGGLV
nr:thioredoxin domain-containing protein [bacterium]